MTNSSNSVDYIIVGQGLAGSILGLTLIKQGFKICLIDEPMDGAASKVAAGIINPITGHRLNITDGMDHFQPSSLDFFNSIETQAQQSFIRELPQYRLIKKQGQLDYWHKRKQQSTHSPYLGNIELSPKEDDKNNQHPIFRSFEFGVAEIKQTYQVDVIGFLGFCRKKIAESSTVIDEAFDHDLINIDQTTVSYKHIKAKRFIFCEGFRAVDNPWWKHLPFKLAKGELLSIQSDNLPKAMLNWGSWVLPDFNQQHLLGASYAWEDTNTDKSPEIADKLMKAFKEKLNYNLPKLFEHRVGIRPTTLHRNPFIGQHTDSPKIMCFNGFGSKGCLTIPYYADLLADHLKHGAKLPEEVTQYL